MNLKNILFVRNTGNIIPKAPITENLFGMKLSGGGEPAPTYFWDFTGATPLTDKIQGQVAKQTGTATYDENGLTVASAGFYLQMGIPLKKGAKYVFEMGSMTRNFSRQGTIMRHGDQLDFCLLTIAGYWAVWIGSLWHNMGIGDSGTYFSNSIITFYMEPDGHISIYKDDVLVYRSSVTYNPSPSYQLQIGDRDYAFKNMTIKSLKVYEPEV